MKSRIVLGSSWAATLLFAVFVSFAWLRDPQLDFPDYIVGYAQWAKTIAAQPLEPASYVHPIWSSHPAGYPALVALTASVFGLRWAGPMLSAMASILTVFITGQLARRILGRTAPVYSLPFLCVNGVFTYHALTETADIVAVPLVLWSLVATLDGIAGQSKKLPLAGALCGTALLIRYQSAYLAPAAVLLILSHTAPRRRSLLLAVSYGLAFLLAASPQLALNTWARGNPAPSSFAAVGYWVNANAERLPAYELWDVAVSAAQGKTILASPGYVDLARHFVRQVFVALFQVEFVSLPLGLLAWAGLLLRLARRPTAGDRLVALFLGVQCVGLGWYVINDRMMLAFVPLFTLYSAHFLRAIIVRPSRTTPTRRRLALLAVAAMFLLMANWYVKPFLTQPLDDTTAQLSRSLRLAGQRSGTEVANFSWRLYDAAAADVTLYRSAVSGARSFGVSDWTSLDRFLRLNHYRFVVAHERDDATPPGVSIYEPATAPSGYELVYQKRSRPRVVAYKLNAFD